MPSKQKKMERQAAKNSFLAAQVEKELNPAVEVDSVSSQIAESKLEKGDENKDNGGKNDPMQTFKTTMFVSGVLIVVAGVALAICKKLRENKA